MTTNLQLTFARLKARKERALIPFLTCSFPDEKKFLQLAETVIDAGADILEIGFPHSDPLADGPVIQYSSHTAISKGFTTEKGFELINRIARRHDLPIVVMCYTNLIYQMGAERFLKRADESGVRGLIVPDMIIEESAAMRRQAREAKVDFVNLVTPTTAPSRIESISRLSSGFVYLVSVTGTTGMRHNVNGNLKSIIAAIKSSRSLPVCVGFGISTPEMAATAAQTADGVIVGSALLQMVRQEKHPDALKKLGTFVRKAKQLMAGEK